MIGISVDRSHLLRVIDPAWTPWIDGAHPEWTWQLRPIDEGLTKWVASRLYYQRPVGGAEPEMKAYEVIIHTPPGKPEWLELLDENAA